MEYVAKSIQEFGFKVPIVIDKNGVIVAGHTRYKAAKEIGMKEVPCIVADDLTEEQAKAFRLADNKVSEFSEWEYNILGDELGYIKSIDMEDFGFEDFNIDNFGTDFSLQDGEKGEIVNMTLTLDYRQKEFINKCLESIKVSHDCYKNTNKIGNAVYEVFMQWEEQKKYN